MCDLLKCTLTYASMLVEIHTEVLLRVPEFLRLSISWSLFIFRLLNP